MADDPDADTFDAPAPFASGVPRCFGCVDLDACRIGITDERMLEGRCLVARVQCALADQAGPRIAHGGWTASVLDEVLGHLALHLGGEPVTATLTIDYLRPVPVERPLLITARVESVEGRKWRIAGVLVLDGSAEPLARASGVWVRRRPDHFQRHSEWLDGTSGRASA